MAGVSKGGQGPCWHGVARQLVFTVLQLHWLVLVEPPHDADTAPGDESDKIITNIGCGD